MPQAETKYTIFEIETKARDLLNKYSEGSFPVNPIKIAELLGYKVFKFDFKSNNFANVSGAINHEEKKIFFNESEDSARSRFTIAHEIGHLMLHPNMDMIDFRTTPSDRYHDVKEQDANRFAAELLMPKEEFEKIYRKYGVISQVASYFGVSYEAASIRAYKLGLVVK